MASTSNRTKSITKRSQDRDLREELEENAMEELSVGLLTGFSLASIPVQPRTTFPEHGAMPFTVEWILPHQLSIKVMPPQIHLKANLIWQYLR